MSCCTCCLGACFAAVGFSVGSVVWSFSLVWNMHTMPINQWYVEFRLLMLKLFVFSSLYIRCYRERFKQEALKILKIKNKKHRKMVTWMKNFILQMCVCSVGFASGCWVIWSVAFCPGIGWVIVVSFCFALVSFSFGENKINKKPKQ